ncbi:hypothetical protein ACLFLG_00820 [Acinetobacter pittii]|uniref:hypothetical protein n=1 Tax=Acinetobacter pittii TaxID=48296 RepID=UPI00397D056D
MNQTQIKLEQLLKISHTVDFNAQYIEGVVCLKEQSDCDLLQEFDDGKIADLSFNTKAYSDFDIGDTVEYHIGLHHTGLQFASYENFIFHQLDFAQNDPLSSEYVIYEEKYKVSKGEEPISFVLKLFADFIKILSEKYFYRDNQIILFSKTHCEININSRNSEKYIDLAKVYKGLKLDEALKKFIDWLLVDNNSNDEGLNKALGVHQSERYSIAASEFVDHLITVDKNERIFNLLKNIDTIYQSALSKYSLYLEDFKYSKFTDKIKKHSEEFLNRINKVISDLQSQILAIPLAISAITFFKDRVNIYVCAGFLIYLLMVFYSCCQQAYNLIHIKNQINQFDEFAKLPKELSLEWKEEIRPIKKKILCHEIFLVLVSLFVGVLIGVCIQQIPVLYIIILSVNYFYLIFYSLVFYSFFKFLKKENIYK